MDEFDRYDQRISGGELHRSYKPQRLLATMLGARELLEARLVIYVAYEMTEIGIQLVQSLAGNGVFVLICMIQEKTAPPVLEGIPNIRVIGISSDTELTEVL